jgi:sensor histidine kinase YesM
MLLQPLVENAVEHGLDGQVEGGTITIKAAQNGSSVLVEVIDTGAGFSDINHPGVGIANVRERLQLLYGDKGRLNVEENAPHGVRAIIEIA